MFEKTSKINPLILIEKCDKDAAYSKVKTKDSKFTNIQL